MHADLLERKFARHAIGAVTADGTFTGYASLFGIVDLGGDVVERGAFTASLAKRGAAGVHMLYQHDPERPIGRWLELRQDARGLFVRGRIALASPSARSVLELMRSGALDGLSIGFRAIRVLREPGTCIRRILEVDLREISVVTFPMLPGARVAAVKTAGAACRWRADPDLPDTIRRVANAINEGTCHDPCTDRHAGSRFRPCRDRRGVSRFSRGFRAVP